MRATNILLLCAALLADSTSAAARSGILNRPRQQQTLSGSGSQTPPSILSTPASLAATTAPASPSESLPESLPPPASSVPEAAPLAPSSSIPAPAPTASPTVDAENYLDETSKAQASDIVPSSSPSASTLSDLDVNSISNAAQPTHSPSSALGALTSSHVETSSSYSDPPITHSASHASSFASFASLASHDTTGLPTTSDATDLPEQTSKPHSDDASGDALSCTEGAPGCLLRGLVSAVTEASASSGTGTDTDTPATPTTEDNRSCTPFPFDKPLIHYSIVYTSTVTFYGNASDYTPPYEPIKTPDYCTVQHSSPTPTAAASAESGPEPTSGLPLPLPTPTLDALVTPIVVLPVPNPSKMMGGRLTVTLPPLPKALAQAVTFITTDKNPAVVFPEQTAPDFSPTFLSVPDTFNPQVHQTVKDPGQVTPPAASGSAQPDFSNSAKMPPKPTYSVTAGGNTVIINDSTFVDLGPGETSTVTVGAATFTLLPTAVAGMGSTITKPPPQETALPTPTSSDVGGVSVAVSGAKAVIDGTTLSIPSRTTSTATIGGQEVTLAPSAIAIGSETLKFIATTPRPTDQVVSGGDLITILGRSLVVLDSQTTLTYGADIPESTTTIGGDTITLGPEGVALRGTTLGGPSAAMTDVELEVVGGYTLGRLPNSKVVINGQTFSLGARGMSRKAVVAGETVTIGNDGLVISSTTIAYPTDAYVTGVIEAPAWGDFGSLPVETGKARNGAAFMGVSVPMSILCLCIAIGVGTI